MANEKKRTQPFFRIHFIEIVCVAWLDLHDGVLLRFMDVVYRHRL